MSFLEQPVAGSTTTASQPDLRELASQVLELTERVVNYLKQDELHPGSTIDPVPANVPQTPEYEALRIPLNEAASDLLRMVNGPVNTLRTSLTMHYDLAAYQVALELGFFEAVPVNGEISLSELAKLVDLDEDRTGRIMRFLATQRVFVEPEPSIFKHTAASALLATNGELNAAGSFQLDEMFRAASETSSWFKASRDGSSQSDSAFSFRHESNLYQYYHQNPLKGARFACAMAGVAQLGDHQSCKLRDDYPWASLGDAKVVDVGGGSGHISMALSHMFPKLNFVVQDVSTVMLGRGQKESTDDLQGRITFMQHDFFQPQPVRDANAFIVRQCLHNWNDRDCIRILQAFVPALEECEPRTPLLINDIVLPPPGTRSRFEEYGLRQFDIAMLVQLGAKQRTAEEFRALLHEADERFELFKIHSDGPMGLLEVHLKK